MNANAREVRRREEQCAQDLHPEAFAETTFQVKSKTPCVADDGDHDGNSEADPYACVSVLKENVFALVDDQIEQDVVCAFSSSGWNVEEESRSGKCVHDELTRQHAKDMGVPVDKRVHSYRPSSQLQTDERRNKGAAVAGAIGMPSMWSNMVIQQEMLHAALARTDSKEKTRRITKSRKRVFVVQKHHIIVAVRR